MPAIDARRAHFAIYFLSLDLLIFFVLCATNPTISPIANFKTNVLGADKTYFGSNKSPIVIPMAPANPPFRPPKSKAANTRNIFPKWIAVLLSVPGIGISIFRNLKLTKHKAANKPICVMVLIFLFIIPPNKLHIKFIKFITNVKQEKNHPIKDGLSEFYINLLIHG